MKGRKTSSNNNEKIIEFRFGDFRFVCPKIYLQFLEEVLILDVYRFNLLKEGFVVLDLGASTGDFCIVASKKVGNNGKVIAVEPNPRDYELLLRNIRLNHCQNIIPINVGVGGRRRMERTNFRGHSFEFEVKPLEEILYHEGIDASIDFVKMDIEGYEAEVVRTDLNKIKNAKVISLEFHGTKEEIDKVLVPLGFVFYPITMRYIYKKLLANLFFHPIPLIYAFMDALSRSHSIINKSVTGFDVTNTYLNGCYLRQE